MTPSAACIAQAVVQETEHPVMKRKGRLHNAQKKLERAPATELETAAG